MSSLRPPRLVPVALAALAAGAVGAAAPAQEAAKPVQPPRVLFESAGGARIVEDFTQALDLAGDAGAAQKDGLLALLAGFLVGVDDAKAVRVEPLTDTSPTRYRLFVPVDDRRDWQQANLDFASGIPSRAVAGKKDTFKLGFVRNAAFDGYMKYFPVAGGGEYAVIVEQLDDLPDRVKKIGGLLQGDQDLSMLVRNTAGDAAAVARRWGRVDEAKRDLLATLQRKPEERTEAYELRKAGAATQVSVMGRFYAEAQVVYGGASVPEGAIGAVSTVLFQPLPGTESAAALETVGAAPSRFAGVPFNEAADFCGQMRYPLTERERTQFGELNAAMRALLVARVNAAGLPEDQRDARLEAFGGLFDAADAVLAEGVLDSVAEVVAVDGGRRVVGAVGLPAGTAVVPAVKAFVASRPGRTAEYGVATVGGVSLHKLTLDDAFAEYAEDFFGSREVWLGTADDAFWYAFGPGARGELEAQATAAAAGGEASGRFLRLTSSPAAFAALMGEVEPAESAYADYREIAREVLAGCGGRVTAVLEKDDSGVVRGRAIAPRCLIALFGRLLAEVSERENLAG